MIKISGGFSIAGQLMVLAFNVVFVSTLVLLIYKNMDFEKLIFLTCIIGVTGFSTVNALDFHDVYVNNTKGFTVKHLFYNKHLAAQEVKSIQAGLLPFSYYLSTTRRDYYFILNSSDLFKEVFTTEPDKVLKALNQTLNRLKQA